MKITSFKHGFNSFLIKVSDAICSLLELLNFLHVVRGLKSETNMQKHLSDIGEANVCSVNVSLLCDTHCHHRCLSFSLSLDSPPFPQIFPFFSNHLLSGRVQTCGPHVERCPQGSNGLPPSFLFLFSIVLLKIKHHRVGGGYNSERSFSVSSQNDGTHSCVCLILRQKKNKKKQPSELMRKPLMQICMHSR